MQVTQRSSSLPEKQEEQQRLMDRESTAEHVDPLEDIDRSEGSPTGASDTTAQPATAVPTPASREDASSEPNHANRTDSQSRSGHTLSSHDTGSNNNREVAASHPAQTAGVAPTDNVHNSGDGGDPSSRASPPPSADNFVPQHAPQRRVPSTSANNSASQEHIRETGRVVPSGSVGEEAPSPRASQSRSQGQVNELSAASFQHNPPPPDQVTFFPTANHMHTNEQVLEHQV